MTRLSCTPMQESVQVPKHLHARASMHASSGRDLAEMMTATFAT